MLRRRKFLRFLKQSECYAKSVGLMRVVGQVLQQRDDFLP
jgi:hypothetical protein